MLYWGLKKAPTVGKASGLYGFGVAAPRSQNIYLTYALPNRLHYLKELTQIYN